MQYSLDTLPRNRILVGNALDILQRFPDNSIHCCITSPPYWSLRDYGIEPVEWPDGTVYCLGLEPTPELYVEHLVMIFREVHRILRDDGTFWLNLGDSYAQSASSARASRPHLSGSDDTNPATRIFPPPLGLKVKDMVGIPWKVAFALRDDGWYLRSDIIWHKTNPMPESVNGWRWEQHRVRSDDELIDCPGCPKCEPTDGLILRKGSWRPTKSHEYLFMLTKSANYFCDAEAVKEKRTSNENGKTFRGDCYVGGNIDNSTMGKRQVIGNDIVDPSSGRNRRDVWSLATIPFPQAHFAVYPPKLIEPCILAGTSEKGVCPSCKMPWVRTVSRTPMEVRPGPGRAGLMDASMGSTSRTACGGTMTKPPTTTTTGWLPSCDCEIENPEPAIVLDPFFGAGTTGVVCRSHGRDCIGIEMNPKYAKIASSRIKNLKVK